MPTDRERALQGWRALRESGARPVGDQVPSRPLSAETASGPLRVALDGSALPRLLLPVAAAPDWAGSGLPEALDLGVVSLVAAGRATLFLDLTCLEAGLEPVFGDVCGAIAVRVADGESVETACRSTLAEFASLFRAGAHAPEDTRTVRGLLGELLYLDALLDRDRRAGALWRGPDGERHDFAGGVRAVEIKTVARPGGPVTIGSFDQLLAPDGGVLHLRVLELREVSGGALSVAEAVDAIAGRVPDSRHFLERVRALGFSDAPGTPWTTLRFEVGQVREWVVDDRFPRITRDALGPRVPGLIDVRYSISPEEAPACEIDASGQAAMMRSLLETL